MRPSPIRHTNANLWSALPVLVLLSGCISLDRLNSPDVEYSENSENAKVLQVPPDLTDISSGEQFILPGVSDDAVARNTLLPVFESARFVRQAGQSWLEIDQAPEEIWPRLLSFTRKKNYTVAQTQPVAGVITTDWREVSDSAGLLKSLIGKEAYSRVAFRLERAGNGSRLFARSQQADKAYSESNPEAAWPPTAHEPENTSELLTELLIFFGIEEQKAKGILNDSTAANLLDDATMQTTAGGSVLVMHKGFGSSFSSVQKALAAEGFNVTRADSQRGVLEVIANETIYVFNVAPVHVSASRISVSGAAGASLTADTEKSVLNELRLQLL